ncbi:MULTISPECIES: iron ABC transporter permease [unclassified Thermoactinomyces]|uniref:FecCD family ABC transporter permease n=1 Tax=unclassified Thermoactinomyces TaxID=2634588 RepID=UPI0018DAFC1C|nr:iron ABC transporter permease [Thermoactinomyces sp. CICC 10523]MBH8604622.1 iron ABC transporter permease [Thermoactinomyces sp. CICC 10522]
MKGRPKKLIWGGGLFLCLLFTFSLSVSLGSTHIDMMTVWKVIGEKWGVGNGSGINATDAVIIWQLRLPRVLLVALVGAILAIAGVVYQGILQNPLADPYILGVSSGASVGAVLAIVTSWGAALLGGWSLPGFAFAGACLALALVLMLARGRSGLNVISLILSGVVVQSFFAALLTFALSFKPEEMQRIQFWLMGGFSLGDWNQVGAVFPFLLIGFPACWLMSADLNLMALGERAAAHLGVNVAKTRVCLLLIASMMTSAAVAVSGMIGFVGLVIPHIMRMLTGADHRSLLPLSALAGAILLLLADCLARTLIAPAELPIGVITSFVGVPFFALILKRHQRKKGE